LLRRPLRGDIERFGLQVVQMLEGAEQRSERIR
jgi:hypothetical protein